MFMMLLICRFVTVALTFGYVLYSHFAEIDLTGYMLKKILNQVRNIFFSKFLIALKLYILVLPVHIKI